MSGVLPGLGLGLGPRDLASKVEVHKLSRRTPALQAFDCERLEERARGHREELERERVGAADAAFAPVRRRARAAAPVAARGR